MGAGINPRTGLSSCPSLGPTKLDSIRSLAEAVSDHGALWFCIWGVVSRCGVAGVARATSRLNR